MELLATAIDNTNRAIGKVVSWFVLLMVLVQFGVVVARYVFGVGNLWAQESIIYMHGFLFTLAAAYTLSEEGHVRVDIFYREASLRYRAWVDLLGALFLLIPVSIIIVTTSWGYVSTSWRVFESSQEASGIPAVFALKTAIPVMGMLLAAQGVTMVIRSALLLSGRMPTTPKHDVETHMSA
ncbi:TRAP transporter small permease subunit [Acuticoccus yangtzensis]|uniref:TRAP transporter small permease subunit n=1 Tax=Acuticoccus yangtzensis TaxID=1443441 RepID=UPI0009495AAB|nr:TRAP transporter small permease subunit [Acuticoccus yangtzensis]ORE92511.1 TRAP dicarboxylate transporter subunit DctQ [Stappia sp. 22II-S9-Z10]